MSTENLLGETTSDAAFSGDRRHRFLLERRWAGLFEAPPVVEGNDVAILDAAQQAAIVIAAWGATSAPNKRGRARLILHLLADEGITLQALAVCRDGSPRHPLYLHSNCRPSPWRPPA